jgi:hypothetical protein
MVLIVAHDARIIPYVDRVFHLEDGVLRESEDTTAQPSVNGTHVAPVTSAIE